MSELHTERRRWVDWKVNVQSLLVGAIVVAASAVGMWFSLISRVATLEEHDKQQEARFEQVERAIERQGNDINRALERQRAEVNEQLRGISQDVKDTNKKVDDLTRQVLMSMSAGRAEQLRSQR